MTLDLRLLGARGTSDGEIIAMRFKFEDFGKKELEDCGKHLCTDLKAVKAHDHIPSEAWTEAILDWFSRSCPSPLVVDARSPRNTLSRGRGRVSIDGHPAFEKLKLVQRETTGEFLLDLTMSDYPSYDSEEGAKRSHDAWWTDALNARPRLRLVLESEWGKPSLGVEGHRHLVLSDASKLLHLQATAKVVLFASVREKDRKETLKFAKMMAKADHTARSGEPVNWLWIDVPWGDWTKTYRPDSWVFAAPSE